MIFIHCDRETIWLRTSVMIRVTVKRLEGIADSIPEVYLSDILEEMVLTLREGDSM